MSASKPPRDGVPEFDGTCRVCGKDSWRDARQFYNHVEALHHERNEDGAEQELARAKRILEDGHELEASEPSGSEEKRGAQPAVICRICNEGQGSPLELYNHVSASHLTDSGTKAQVELQRAESLMEDGASQTPEATDSMVEDSDVSPFEDLERAALENLKTAGENERRQQRVQDLVLAWLDQKDIDYTVDEHGVLHAQLPKQPGTSATIDWPITFDRATANERYVELVNYTNPYFQRILRDVTDKPVLAYRLVLEAGEAEDIRGWRDNLIRTDFAYHITYSTYGDTREEMVSFSIGETDHGASIITDAFHSDPEELPDELLDHYARSRSKLEDHVAERLETFAEGAADRLEEDRERMDKVGQNTVRRTHGQTQIAEDQQFYEEAAERQKGALETRYRVDLEIKLITVEPYFQPPKEEAQ